ncbi:MAG: hypothetical protein ABIR79_10820 [Candidatus Binatia bacterium]
MLADLLPRHRLRPRSGADEHVHDHVGARGREVAVGLDVDRVARFATVSNVETRDCAGALRTAVPVLRSLAPLPTVP